MSLAEYWCFGVSAPAPRGSTSSTLTAASFGSFEDRGTSDEEEEEEEEEDKEEDDGSTSVRISQYSQPRSSVKSRITSVYSNNVQV